MYSCLIIENKWYWLIDLKTFKTLVLMHTNFLESTCVCDVTVPLLHHSDERLRCIVKHMSIQARALLRGSAPAPGQIAPGRGKHFAPGHFVAPGQIACRGSPAPAPQHCFIVLFVQIFKRLKKQIHSKNCKIVYRVPNRKLLRIEKKSHLK